ncbi:MAG: FAD-dependent oxidoreductase [Geodermatophilaceae bacterium]|nr:FAD-dependent oxidoreductase [Geodermatophilaceae bacterium]
MRITVDGLELAAEPGDSLASALLRSGRRVLSQGIYTGRPRGLVSAGAEESNVFVQVLSGPGEPMVRATDIEAYDGLRVRTLAGKGLLPVEPDGARYDKTFMHTDVLVVGGGPAGLMAALTAGESGARVLLVDDQPSLGGRLLASGVIVNGLAAADWIDSMRARLAALHEVVLLSRTAVTGYYDHNYLVAVERRTDHLGAAAPEGMSRQRLWNIRAGQVVLATGAHERSIAFPDNDRPGIMLAVSAAAYAGQHGCLPGRRAVVFGAHDGALAAAVDLADAGVDVAAVLDVRDAVGPGLGVALAERGIGVRTGTVVRGTLADGDGVLRAVLTSAGDTIEADLLAVSGGWNPAVELFSQSGGRTAWSEKVAGFLPDRPAQPTHCAGALTGLVSLERVLAQGARAGAEAAHAAGFEVTDLALPALEAGPPEGAPPAACFLVDSSAEESDRVFVDLQRDVTLHDVRRALGAGLTSVEHIKRYTTIGTAADQGRGSGVLAVGVLAHLSGRSMAEIGTTTYRPPYTPISFALLAGRDRGRLADPERITAMHDWHVGHGAVFEDVGQWKRPRFFPQGEESMDDAVRRECTAARSGVAMMDASTLGTIELQGADVGVLLDRLYTNVFSTLAVGRVRYGVMCGPDGMVLDDGTTARLAEDRWLMSTTTGNAAKILDWLEEWRQTEWPTLDVRCTSVTDQWSTIALVGPRARDVLTGLAPELDCSVDGFPFMTVRHAAVAGLPARIMRVSFSGELAYEISVASWYAPALWEAVHEAGQRHDITPYGTETMHVLRAEKGYPIVGQDTDGTVTPQDLGMDWIVSKKKPDFLGKRSFVRADTSRPDRRQLVGVVPVDGRSRVAEGAQLVDHGAVLTATPVPMHGHVTSSYDSVALGTPFALALLEGGSTRCGEVLDAVDDGIALAVRVVSAVPYDPAGTRRDG